MISSAGDGLRFFDLLHLRPLGGWKTSSIAEITALTVEGESFFLFGESSCLYILTEKIMLEHAQGTYGVTQIDFRFATSIS